MPIEWMLVTSAAVQTVEDATAVVDHSRARWLIEDYFKALKTGCAFEKRQLTTFDGLVRALAIFVRWRGISWSCGTSGAPIRRGRSRNTSSASACCSCESSCSGVATAFHLVQLSAWPHARHGCVGRSHREQWPSRMDRARSWSDAIARCRSRLAASPTGDMINHKTLTISGNRDHDGHRGHPSSADSPLGWYRLCHLSSLTANRSAKIVFKCSQ